MRTIHKYALFYLAESNFNILMPKSAKILTLQCKAGEPCLWAEVDTFEGKVERTFRFVGTGHLVPDSGEYVGTFQDLPFVWHLYELKGEQI